MLAAHTSLRCSATRYLLTVTQFFCYGAAILVRSRQTKPELAKRAGLAMLQFLFLLLHQLHHVLQKAQLAATAAAQSTTGRTGPGTGKAANSPSKTRKLDNGAAFANANLHSPEAIHNLIGELGNLFWQHMSG